MRCESSANTLLGWIDVMAYRVHLFTPAYTGFIMKFVVPGIPGETASGDAGREFV